MKLHLAPNDEKSTLRDILHDVYVDFRWKVIRPLQKFFTGYSYDMAWNACSAMAEKCYPIFRDFAKIPPHGAPTHIILTNNKALYNKMFGKERVAAYLKDPSVEDEELTSALFEHWNDIIQKVLFSLEHVGHNKEDYPASVYDPNPNYDPKQQEPFYSKPVEGKEGYHQLIFNEDYGKTKLNPKRMHEFETQVTEGFRLLGLYWQGFWD